MSQVLPETVNQLLQPLSPTGFPNGVQLSATYRQFVMWQLTAADLLAMPTTKPVIVPAPGTTLLVVPSGIVAQYHYGGTAFTLGNADNALQLEYVGKTTALGTIALNGLATLTGNANLSVASLAAGVLTAANSVNLGIEVTVVGTTPALTLGNGSIYITMEYKVIPTF